MLRIYLTLTIILSAFVVFADNISVSEFKETNEIMIASNDFRKDANGNLCALIRVVAPSSMLGFEGSVIGEVEYKINEYWVFLSPGAKMLKIKCAGMPSLTINVAEYIGSGVRSKGIYQLNLHIPHRDNKVTPSDISASEKLLLGKQLMERKDTVTAVKWFRMAAENGDGEAMCLIGDYCQSVTKANESYVRRITHQQKSDSSLYWYNRSAKTGFPEGMYKAAINTKWWINLKDTTYVRQNLEMASKMGYAPAYCQLGKYYEARLIDYDCNVDELDTGDRFLLQQYPSYILQLKDCQENHKQSDLDNAEFWYIEGLKYDEANCYYHLGNLYRNHKYNLSQEERLQKSFEFWSKAATLNHLDAMYEVWQCFKNGKGVRQNDRKAFESLEAIVKNGYYTPEVYIELAKIYQQKKDEDHLQKAYNLCKRIVDGKNLYTEKKTKNATCSEIYDAAEILTEIEQKFPSFSQAGFTIVAKIWSKDILYEPIGISVNNNFTKYIDDGEFVLMGVHIGDSIRLNSAEAGEYIFVIDKNTRSYHIPIDKFKKRQ